MLKCNETLNRLQNIPYPLNLEYTRKLFQKALMSNLYCLKVGFECQESLLFENANPMTTLSCVINYDNTSSCYVISVFVCNVCV